MLLTFTIVTAAQYSIKAYDDGYTNCVPNGTDTEYSLNGGAWQEGEIQTCAFGFTYTAGSTEETWESWVDCPENWEYINPLDGYIETAITTYEHEHILNGDIME